MFRTSLLGYESRGWTGIDAHWNAKHEDIMPYADVWPTIKSGGRPSDGTEEPSVSDREVFLNFFSFPAGESLFSPFINHPRYLAIAPAHFPERWTTPDASLSAALGID